MLVQPKYNFYNFLIALQLRYANFSRLPPPQSSMKYNAYSLLAVLTLASQPAFSATLTSGHVDFIGIGYDDSNFEPHSHVENGVVDGVSVDDIEYGLGDLIVQISAVTTRAAGAAFDPIGVVSGASYWTATESADENVLPLVGIGLEELDPLDWEGDITVTLTGATIPAGAVFSMWKGEVTPLFSFSTLGGISAADSISLAPGAHIDFNWGFTEVGDYDLTFLIEGTHAVDGFKSTPASYTFSVIPEPSAALLGAVGALGLLRRRRN